MDTIIDLFEQSCSKYPDNPYLWEKIGGKYEAMTYARTRQRVREIAGGLLYAGLKKGQRVALLAEGCADWVCLSGSWRQWRKSMFFHRKQERIKGMSH